MNQLSRLIIACFLIIGLAVAAADTPQPCSAPQLAQRHISSINGKGFVPPPVDLSYLDGSQGRSRFATLDTPPARWDWREQGKVTSVKNQGACGSCYAFGSIANIESKLLMDGAGSFDFSENNAKECNWYANSCDGGSYYNMASFFAKYGVVLESCDPYEANDVDCNSSCTYIKTLLDWCVISGNAVPAAADLKNYIYANGPVYTTMYAGDASDTSWDSEFNSYNGSYVLYYTGSYATNHAVLIVGWDDTLSHAGGQGAWIVKNSWGTSWGGNCGYGSEGGYFKIAYGSANIGMWSSYVESWQDYDDSGELLFHDEGGWTCSWGYNFSTSVWSLAKFVPTSSDYLTRIELWTNDATSDIDIYIYDDFASLTPSNLLDSKLNSSFTEAGYHSIALSNPPSLSNGDAIYVVVHVINASASYPIVGDNQGTPEVATSYMSPNGANGTWYDLGANQNSDVGIRIRTSATVGISEPTANVPYGKLMLRNYPNPFNSRTNIEYGLPVDSHVLLNIYDILGRQVETLINEYQTAGNHQILWDSQGMPTGYYFYKIQVGGSFETGKMLLLK